MNKLLPLFFDLKGKSILLVGAGRVAFEKLEKLVRTEATITIVAPDISEEVLDLAYLLPDRITLIKREYREGDAAKFSLVIVATNNHLINEPIVKDARDHSKFVNAVDDPAHCDFIFSAQIHYGSAQIAVSSAGKLPGLTKALREILEEILPREHDDEVERLINLRNQLKKSYPNINERTQIFRHLLKQWEDEYLRPQKSPIKKHANTERNISQ